jgi:cadmium resistance protein CadD (predicted permease)
VTTSLLVTALVAFAGTTIDDLVILAALFTARRSVGTPATSAIVGGQYAGFAGILGVALLAAAGLQVVPDRWVGLLGLVPIGFGVWALWRARRADARSRPTLAVTLPGIAVVTFANGADNLSMFTPLFRSLHPTEALLVAAMFLALVGIWCAAGAWLGSQKAVVAALGGVSHWLVPAVFIVVGLSILVASRGLSP